MADDLREWRHHWQDEADAAYLYHTLAAVELDADTKGLYARLANMEERHTAIWGRLLAERNVELPPPTPTVRSRVLAWWARRFGPDSIVKLLLHEEGQEVRTYLDMHARSEPGEAADTALTLARDSAKHADDLAKIANIDGEPWHRIESSGTMANIVYGFNDGLTANFGLIAGLIAGVLAADLNPKYILLTGLAGAIADALSMGSSSYLAAKSTQEVRMHEIAMEKKEIELMPEIEEEELALMYESRGLLPERAKQVASEIMASPEKALEEMIREELRLGDEYGTPVREGWITGVATAIGAIIPVIPFFISQGHLAIWSAFVLAMISHFVVGAARSFFTGRNLWRSGFDMFVVGLGVAAIGYFVGDLATRLLGLR
jgi:VIT1/CCC1 family predicted Fe2+/Mn2+ transporter